MYLTLSELKSYMDEAEIARLSDKDFTEVINEVRVNDAIVQASADIDSYLRGSYTLPLPSVPVELKSITARLTEYYLYVFNNSNVSEAVQKNYEYSLSALKEFAKGIRTLNIQDSGAVVSPAAPRISTNKKTKYFTKDLFDKYVLG